ncbi:hypothetical protein CL622_02745 [archaeon]|nr:hypothetical protein [archaeon]|tara:strand:+ start:104 stop:1357 length:1254 start_codon:yes stop_codon:yes gene_type:complete
MTPIERETLRNIKPTHQEQHQATQTIKFFLNKLNQPNAELGGSAARGTWLKPVFDVDIFVRFDPKNNKTDQISQKLETILKKKFKTFQKIHGSRDYFQIPFKSYLFELIPVLKIRSPSNAKNITDLSPLHVRWLNKHTTQSIKNEILLTKQFCKAQNCYGAESYINGFSGYVLEILLVHYHTLQRFLKASIQWTPKVIIDVEKHHKKSDVITTLNQAKTNSPLIVIDPIWPERNAAAALSLATFERFKKAAKKYLANPTSKSFSIPQFDLKKEIGNAPKPNYIILEVTVKDTNKDIGGTKILKTFKRLNQEILHHGFTIKKAGWHWEGTATLWFIVHNGILSKQKKHIGPPKNQTDAVKSFQKRWRHTKVKTDKTGKCYVIIRRKYPNLQNLITNLIKQPSIKNKVTTLKICKQKHL